MGRRGHHIAEAAKLHRGCQALIAFQTSEGIRKCKAKLISFGALIPIYSGFWRPLCLQTWIHARGTDADFVPSSRPLTEFEISHNLPSFAAWIFQKFHSVVLLELFSWTCVFMHIVFLLWRESWIFYWDAGMLTALLYISGKSRPLSPFWNKK